MAKSLRVLIVEDLEDDAILILRNLEREGYDVSSERVETAEAMTAALEKQAWDIIIADYKLPHFSAPAALELLKETGYDIPFIVTSGTIGEETAVKMMIDGANDYMMKSNLQRLAPAVKRELHESEIRQQHIKIKKDLEDSERSFKDIFDGAMDGIILIDIESNTLSLGNRSACQMLGYSLDELKNLKIGDIHPKDKLLYVTEQIERQLRQEITIVEDIPIKRKDGRVFYADVNSSPIVLSGKTYLMGIYRDITERKKAEEDIRKFKVIADTAAYGVSISDLTGKLLYINESYARMHGYQINELLEKHFSVLYPKDQIEFMKRRRERIEEIGSSIDEIWHIKEDGSRFPILSTGTLVKDEERKPLFIAATHIDISERKHAEVEIMKFKTLADNATYGVSITNPEGVLIFVNESQAHMHGYTVDELIGRHFSIVFTEEQLKKAYELRNQLQETGGFSNAEVWHKKKDGSIFPTLMDGVIIKDEKGAPLYLSSNTIDITERKKMEEQLILTDRLASVGELASGIAHELNNPLTGVIGFSELLIERDIPKDIREDLIVINREAQRTAKIVRNLLTFARKHPTDKKPLDINIIIQSVLEIRAYEQNVNNIKVHTLFASDLPDVTANDSQLQQVFINIVINAEQAMIEAHGGGTFTVTTEQIGDIVRASFSDDGPGIAEEYLDHLFDPFFTTKEVGKGTGLGLSICHGIITENGGKIYAESELGKGATFVIELPVINVDAGGTTNENS